MSPTIAGDHLLAGGKACLDPIGTRRRPLIRIVLLAEG